MRAPQRTDLRDAIIAAGIELGDTLGIEGVTMRAIATRLGVSVTQLYQHFDNKVAIVDQMRFSGLARLDAALAATRHAGDGAARLHGMAVAYLTFAHHNRWLYALMFDGPIIDWEATLGRERDVALGPMHTTRQVFTDGVAEGVFAADLDPDAAVLAIWAALHGCASLGLRGWLAMCQDGRLENECAHAIASHLVAGFCV